MNNKGNDNNIKKINNLAWMFLFMKDTTVLSHKLMLVMGPLFWI